MVNGLTVGEIANRLGEPLHRVQYVLRTRWQLRPACRVGNARVYNESDLQFIAGELRRIAIAKGLIPVPRETPRCRRGDTT
jgi:hypothetical protein